MNQKSKTLSTWQNHTLDELVAYVDAHDLGDYLDRLPEVEFEVDIQEKTHVFSLDEDIAEKLTEIANSEKKLSKELIHSWLKAKIESYHLEAVDK
jgi:predicted HD phosphohydrolase